MKIHCKYTLREGLQNTSDRICLLWGLPLTDPNVIIGRRLEGQPAGKEEGRFEVTGEGAITAAR